MTNADSTSRYPSSSSSTNPPRLNPRRQDYQLLFVIRHSSFVIQRAASAPARVIVASARGDLLQPAHVFSPEDRISWRGQNGRRAGQGISQGWIGHAGELDRQRSLRSRAAIPAARGWLENDGLQRRSGAERTDHRACREAGPGRGSAGRNSIGVHARSPADLDRGGHPSGPP